MTKAKGNIILGIERSHFAFYMAHDFFVKGIEVTKEVHPPEFRFNTKNHWRICYPVCVLAFGLELGLKGFLTQKQAKAAGHRLISMYHKIDPAIQDAIENHFETCKAHRYGFFNVEYKPSNASITKTTSRLAKDKITDALQRNGQPFIDFRYLYEKDKKDTYSFDFNIIIRLTHAALAIRAEQLGIDLNKVTN